jgi:ketosteroid isomerase-like protein
VSDERVTEEDLERLRNAYATWNRGDAADLVEQLDPEFELHDLDVPDAPVFRGREGFLANIERMNEVAESFRIEVQELMPAGDRILALVHVWLKGRGSGVEVEQDIGHVWTLRGGKGLRLEIYLDPARARQAVESGEAGSD